MGAGDVAAWIRGKALLQRRAGPDLARHLASAGTLPEALEQLAATPYGYAVRSGMELPAAQRAVSGALLWHLRILAGWQPPGASNSIRALAAGFEVANTVDLLLSLEGADRPDPFDLGSLSTAWRALRRGRSPAQVRDLLGRSRWGDPGSSDPATTQLTMTVDWAYRVWDEVPEAAPWARAAGRLLADHLKASGAETDLNPLILRRLQQLAGRDREPEPASPSDGGPAWVRWWEEVAAGAATLAGGGRPGPGTTVGVVGLLAADAWRLRAALAFAGSPEGRDGWEDLVGAVA